MTLWGRLMQAARTGLAAGVNDFRDGPQPTPWETLQQRYADRWLLYRGELFLDVWRSNPYKNDPRVYRNIALLWNHTSRVVDFYGTIIYQGALKDDPGEGAIPVLPDPALGDTEAATLMRAIGTLWRKWNYQHQMVIRPKLGAALGDVLTELIDDSERRFVYPRLVWPGYVKHVELDYVGQVRAYTLEYSVTEERDNGATETYTYRKEVTAEDFRYFKDDKPFDYTGEGAVVENIYGFCPAIWDRHIATLGERGDAATDVSRQALFQLNSLFSHARDFQHKAFFAPVLVTGQLTQPGQTTINLATPTESGSALAQRLKVLEADPGSTIEQPTFDLGQTMEQLELMKAGILGMHPEATFFDRLAEAQNVTGPGADRIITPVRGLVEHARAGYDASLVRLVQMAISMCGMRVNEGDWDLVPGPLDGAREAFRPYTLDSYDQGLTAFEIGQRDIVLPGRAELIEQAQGIESLSTLYGLRMAGLSDTDAEELIREREARYAAALNAGTFGGDYEDTSQEAV